MQAQVYDRSTVSRFEPGAQAEMIEHQTVPVAMVHIARLIAGTGSLEQG